MMRLSLMLVKSLVFDFRRERERLCLVFPFFCSLFAPKMKKIRVKVKIIVCKFAYIK